VVLACYDAALAAAAPGAVVHRAFATTEVTLELGRDRPHWILAFGKAADAMAAAALAGCEARSLHVAGGLVVTSAADGLRHGTPGESAPEAFADAGLERVVGDHPVPGVRSARAADALAACLERIGGDDVVIVCISGGTSSLIGAPIAGVRREDLASLHALLLGAGLPISRSNAVRKRFSRWGAGRLAAALECARVIPILLADVPNEDPAIIGSGPVSPDPLSAWHVEHILREAGLAVRVPLSIASMLGAMRAEAVAETPKPGSEVFARVEPPFVVGNSAALDAAAAEASRAGFAPVLLSNTILTGDATAAGRVIAHAIARATPGSCLIWGGETTVRLPADHGLGGRCQQLALSAAETLADLGTAATILAAGTDGQDGPAPAAGALVDGQTWTLSRDADADPARALARCDAFGALHAADALLPARHTGTNVMDIVVAVRHR
jgi:hydroxypyruvate reductase